MVDTLGAGRSRVAGRGRGDAARRQRGGLAHVAARASRATFVAIVAGDRRLPPRRHAGPGAPVRGEVPGARAGRAPRRARAARASPCSRCSTTTTSWSPSTSTGRSRPLPGPVRAPGGAPGDPAARAPRQRRPRAPHRARRHGRSPRAVSVRSGSSSSGSTSTPADAGRLGMTWNHATRVAIVDGCYRSSATARARFRSTIFSAGQRRHELREPGLEHERQEVAAKRRRPRQAFIRSQHDLRRQAENLGIDGRTDHGRHVVVLGDEGSRDDDVESWLPTPLRDALSRPVNLAARHGRACAATSRRASRASCFLLFRKISRSRSSI